MALLKRLEKLYGEARAPEVLLKLEALIEAYRDNIPAQSEAWDQTDTFLITYADSLRDEHHSPLQCLRQFLDTHVHEHIRIVHLLPFFPWTSDDGFSVSDYRSVNPEVGHWEDVTALSHNRRLCFDAVVNHVSQSSRYVQGYLQRDPAYENFVISLDPNTDTHAVTRPRNLPLLHEFERRGGERVWLWTTFSRDQVDLNVAQPDVLLEIIDVLLFYAQRGASLIRLDAIPFLWKTLGTSCVHLPQTHEIVKLFREVFNAVAPHVILLTETNVPHDENMSYFGRDGDEAQMIYNFSLAPLIVWSLLRADARYLTQWAEQVKRVGAHATYLNITATHDGIGLRPTEGILSDDERQILVDSVKARGGQVSEKRNPDGSTSPYELNISYFDAINAPGDSLPLAQQVERFMVSQTIALSFIGIPGIYIHSLLGTRNDLEGAQRTGRARSINRATLQIDALDATLATPESLPAQVLHEYKRRLGIRAGLAAFHPDAEQTILSLGDHVFALERHAPKQGQCILALHNVSDQTIQVPLAAHAQAYDALNRDAPLDAQGNIMLAPYQCRWLVTDS